MLFCDNLIQDYTLRGVCNCAGQLISPQEEKQYLSRYICVHNSRSLSVTRGAMIQCHIAAPRRERFSKDGIQPGDIFSSCF